MTETDNATDNATETETTETARNLELCQFLSGDQPADYGRYSVTIPGPFASLGHMEKANKQNGGHYFDADAKRFFRSRINTTIHYNRFFIDSIQFVSSRGEKAAREYKIVAVLDNGSTHSTVARRSDGTWAERFPALEQARGALKRLVKDQETAC